MQHNSLFHTESSLNLNTHILITALFTCIIIVNIIQAYFFVMYYLHLGLTNVLLSSWVLKFNDVVISLQNKGFSKQRFRNQLGVNDDYDVYDRVCCLSISMSICLSIRMNKYFHRLQPFNGFSYFQLPFCTLFQELNLLT